jgi:hypothetical protein
MSPCVPVLLLTINRRSDMAGDTDSAVDEDVPVLVSLGDEDVPVCEDGSCAL